MSDKNRENGKAFKSKLALICKDHPHLIEWAKSIDCAVERFEGAVDDNEARSIGEEMAHCLNCLIELHLAVGTAHWQAGFSNQSPFDIREEIIAHWDRHDSTRRQLSLGHERAIAVAVAYQSGFCPSNSGANDSRMEVARQVAALLEGLKIDPGAETIKKSIQRFRRELKGREVFSFDRNTLRVSCQKAEDAFLHGLPKKRGRPLSSKGDLIEN